MSRYDFYAALIDGQKVGLALPHIGLVTDPDISTTDDIVKKLQDNYEMAEWLSNLDSQAFRTLSRAISIEQDGLKQVFRKVKAFSTSPSRENLQSLTLRDVQQLREAPKTPQPKSISRRENVPGNYLLIDQLLNAAQEKDNENQKLSIQHLEEEARQVSRMFFHESYLDDCILGSIAEEDKGEEDENNDDFVIITDYITGEETGRIERYKNKGELRHPLCEPYQAWIKPLCWGGEVDANITDQEIVNLAQIFNGVARKSGQD